MTTSFEFFVSLRKKISGEYFLLSSRMRWIVADVCMPQQFQLQMAKEHCCLGAENPSVHSDFVACKSPQLYCFVDLDRDEPMLGAVYLELH